MNIEKKLFKLKNEMRDLEKKEQRLTGTLEALTKTVKKDLGDQGMPDNEIVKATRKKIKDLKGKREKANGQLTDKMEIIDEMMETTEA